MQKHHDAIAAVMSAASQRNASVLAPVDAFQLVMSLIEHATMAQYWLQLARQLRKLPAEDESRHHDLSPQKSREYRMGVLARIRSSCQIAVELMNQLFSATPPGAKEQIRRLFETFSLEMICVQILAVICARDSASGGSPIPQGELDEMLTELDKVRFSPGFRHRPNGDQNLLWQTLAVLQEARGDKEKAAAALAERTRLAGDDPDSRLLNIADLVGYSEGAGDRLKLVNQLRELAEDSRSGPIFSRARLGRISIFRDAFWRMAVEADTDDVTGRALFEDCLAHYEEWLFGKALPASPAAVRLLAAWNGAGRMSWMSSGELRRQSFPLDLELAGRLHFAMEGSLASERKALRAANSYLAGTLGPLLSDALDRSGELRIQALGPMGTLPVLATPVAGRVLGGMPSVAYRHPNPAASFQAEGMRSPLELLVIDKCFGEHSRSAETAARLAASRSSAECRILSFNSDEGELDPGEVIDALRAVSSAIIFGHAESPAANASAAGLVLGATSRLRVDVLAASDLNGLAELAMIGCGTGRNNLFLGEVTLAHAAAVAGAGEILYTLWPIRPGDGARIAGGILHDRLEGKSTREYLAHQFEEDVLKAEAFAIMRP